EKSALSGKTVVVTGDYELGSKFISGDELEGYSKLVDKGKLNINSIKDIDSILSALQERFYYSGNDVLGNSSNAVLSNRVVDSTYVYKAHDVFYSKYVAHTYLSKYSEYIFGGHSIGKGTHFAAKAFETYEASRIWEGVHIYLSQDIIYSSNLENCQNCLFSFNLRSKRRCIGNLELPADKFAALKEKLQGEIADTLEAKHTAISVVEIVGKGN
ncbi:MAG: hypothetical protein NTV88_04650, partial [Candidatus Micrarchaeota archaeon]|nr:hypothetical protein [Candidatus Micrarchaeota archaeon]